MKKYLSVFIAVLLIPHLLSADDKQEVTFTAGYSFFDVDQNTFDCVDLRPDRVCLRTEQALNTGFQFGFKYGHYITKAIEVEGNFQVSPGIDLMFRSSLECMPNECSDILRPPLERQQAASSYYYGGNFLYHLREGDIRPFFRTGLGGLTTDFGPLTETDFALNFGAGLKFPLKPVGFRAEIVDYVIPDHFATGKVEHDLEVQYGILFSF